MTPRFLASPISRDGGQVCLSSCLFSILRGPLHRSGAYSCFLRTPPSSPCTCTLTWMAVLSRPFKGSATPSARISLSCRRTRRVPLSTSRGMSTFRSTIPIGVAASLAASRRVDRPPLVCAFCLRRRTSMASLPRGWAPRSPCWRPSGSPCRVDSRGGVALGTPFSRLVALSTYFARLLSPLRPL